VSPSRRNLQSFLGTMAAHGERGGFARAGTARRHEASWAGALVLAGAAAAALRANGIGAGDRVVLLLEDGPFWISGFAACLATGAVAVPLEPSSPRAFVRSVVERSGAKAMIVAGGPGGSREGQPAPRVARIDLAALGPGDASGLMPLADPEPTDLAEIVFTSGTTAAPRGVMITHANILTALAGIERGILARKRLLRPFTPITILSLVPLSHLFGQALGFFIPAILGARVVFSPSGSPRALLRLARRERAWVIVMVPRHLAGLRDHFAHRAAALAGSPSGKWWRKAWRARSFLREHGWRLRALVVGGARLDPALERFFKDLGYLVVQGYGLTETAPIVAVSNPFDDRVGLLGKPTRAQEVRLAGDGEILVRGGNVTPGYFEDAEATRAVLEDGWLRTGDLGAMEPDGSLRFVGRKKEVIVTGEGQNVFPDEVEAALERESAIAGACVFSLPGPGGEEVRAAILASPSPRGVGPEEPVDREEAVARAVASANERLAPHQRVKGWSLWSDLDFPRTATGKVLRRVVAAALRGSPEPRGDEEAAGPLESLRRMAGAEARSDQRLGAELGLSSIDVAELAASIEERYQVEIDPARIHDDVSLDQLLEEARSGADPRERWPMPRWAGRLPARLARRLLQSVVAFPLLRLFVRLEARGRDALRDLAPPFLIAANHASHLDVPVLLAALPGRLRRRVAVAMQPGYFETYLTKKGPLPARIGRGGQYGLVTLLLNTFPFPRSAAFGVARDYAGEIADRGGAILVFPEGELSRDGAIHGFRPGVGVLARDLGLPVLPARIEGLFEVLPRGGRFPRGLRRPARVAWGTPLTIRSGEDPEAFAGRVEEAVTALR